MIDIGFSKLILVGVVALVVIGPERLPRVARMAGSLLGRAQRYLNDVKNEVNREIQMEDLRKMQQDLSSAAQDIEQSVQSVQDASTRFGSEPARDAEPVQKYVRTGPDQDKIQRFRKKKLSRTTSAPAWYKNQTGRRIHVQSAAARVSRYSPAKTRDNDSGFF